jgi:hypothetical protein
MKYRVTFERIGRKRGIKPQEFVAADLEQLAEKIHTFAYPYIMSSEHDVVINEDGCGGYVAVGMGSVAGNFTIEVIS